MRSLKQKKSSFKKQEIYTIYKDILHIFLSGAFNRLPYRIKKSVFPKGIDVLMMLLLTPYRLLKHYIISLFKGKKTRKKSRVNFSNKIWLYAVSKNNYDSLKFIIDKIQDCVFIGSYRKHLPEYDKTNVEAAGRIKYYYKLPSLLRKINQESHNLKKNFFVWYNFLGYYEFFLKTLKIYKPIAIIFSNDHNPDQRSLLLAAKKLKIPTIYIQHASISEFFPPLKFDLSLLEGQDSLNKYKKIGNMEGEVHLIGMPKFDKYYKHRNFNKSIENIGVSMSLLDSPDIVLNLVKRIKSAFPNIKIHFRHHPREKRDLSEIINICHFSDSTKEEVFSYLGKIDFQIASSSSIHLEAILLNIPSVYCYLIEKNKLMDGYGYIESGLIKKYKDADALIKYINHIKNKKPDVYMKAKPYNDLIGTSYEGDSVKMAIEYIDDLLKDSTSSRKKL